MKKTMISSQIAPQAPNECKIILSLKRQKHNFVHISNQFGHYGICSKFSLSNPKRDTGFPLKLKMHEIFRWKEDSSIKWA